MLVAGHLKLVAGHHRLVEKAVERLPERKFTQWGNLADVSAVRRCPHQLIRLPTQEHSTTPRPQMALVGGEGGGEGWVGVRLRVVGLRWRRACAHR